ncbi:unnamed protein product [Meloidogyne enterolobii]|uniref:Uncharacterized protein n=1 Tax=Meloidogyne enterolobii TaxID=390850 RepID=A0ACB0XTE6_MELEN
MVGHLTANEVLPKFPRPNQYVRFSNVHSQHVTIRAAVAYVFRSFHLGGNFFNIVEFNFLPLTIQSLKL